MGQVLGFGHCKEAPSTASTTPDSTEGGPEEPDFPELQAAQPPPEEEEEEDEGVGGALLEGGGRYGPPPRELTFSYIAFPLPSPNPQGPPPDPHLPNPPRTPPLTQSPPRLPRTNRGATF